tara:strand:- start:793 stop:1152 length:360 start_codon:yes stop_codon:yes gene_type:complete
MVDVLTAVSEEKFESDFQVLENNVLVENGHLSASGLIENVAQTSAAGFGITEVSQNGQPTLGYIGSITKVEIFELPAVGETVHTIVTPTHRLGNIVMVSGTSFVAQRQLMVCEMKIVIK